MIENIRIYFAFLIIVANLSSIKIKQKNKDHVHPGWQPEEMDGRIAFYEDNGYCYKEAMRSRDRMYLCMFLPILFRITSFYRSVNKSTQNNMGK